jgi:hypothetical protein
VINWLKIRKWAAYAVVSIFLSALGSPLWELVLEPAWNILANSVVSFLGSFSEAYLNTVYAEASNVSDIGGKAPAGVAYILVSSAIIFIIGIIPKNMKYSVILEAYKGRSGILLGGFGFFYVFFILSFSSTVGTIKNYSVKHLDIIRADITDKEFYKLKAKYLEMKSEHDFNEFLELMYLEYKKHNREIKLFNE